MAISLEKIRAELQRISEDHDGTLTPDAVIEVARDPQNVLHLQFEWDDSVAAEQWRLNQARSLIRGVSVRVITETIPVSVKSWIPDPDRSSREQGYVQTMQLLSDREKSERALDAELNRVSSSVARARDIALALHLQHEIDQRIMEAAGITLPKRGRGAA